MEWLHSQGWRTIPSAGLRAGLVNGEWPERSFVLTFDDGFAGVLDSALPVLQACGFSAIVFVVAGWVGRTNDWPGQAAWAPRRPLLGWPELRQLAQAGIEIGAHSISHPHLTQARAEERRAEIIDCRQAIEDAVGCPVRTFAYPYGETSLELEALVSEAYDLGFGTHLGYVGPGSRAAVLERVDAYYVQQRPLLHGLGRDYLAPYLALREQMRGARRIMEEAKQKL